MANCVARFRVDVDGSSSTLALTASMFSFERLVRGRPGDARSRVDPVSSSLATRRRIVLGEGAERRGNCLRNSRCVKITDELLRKKIDTIIPRSDGVYRSIVPHNKFRLCLLQNCQKTKDINRYLKK